MWKEKNKIPDRISINESDNKLLIDLRIKDSQLLFIDTLLKKRNILIQEVILNTENSIIKDVSNETYFNEILIPLKNRAGMKYQTIDFDHRSNSIQRVFPPLDNCLYFKIYGSNNILEQLLLNELVHIIDSFKNYFSFFFFLRYFDSGNHLRLRFFSSNRDELLVLQKNIVNSIRPYILNDTISDVQIGTYKRELERYGFSNMQNSENIFYVDSKYTLSALKKSTEENYRWAFAIRSIDEYLNTFNYQTDKKYDFVKKMKTIYFKEFGGNPKLISKLNNLFKTKMHHWNDTFNEDTSFINNLLTLRTKEMKNILNNINNEYIWETDRLLSSYIHMSINRLFTTE